MKNKHRTADDDVQLKGTPDDQRMLAQRVIELDLVIRNLEGTPGAATREELIALIGEWAKDVAPREVRAELVKRGLIR